MVSDRCVIQVGNFHIRANFYCVTDQTRLNTLSIDDRHRQTIRTVGLLPQETSDGHFRNQFPMPIETDWEKRKGMHEHHLPRVRDEMPFFDYHHLSHHVIRSGVQITPVVRHQRFFQINAKFNSCGCRMPCVSARVHGVISSDSELFVQCGASSEYPGKSLSGVAAPIDCRCQRQDRITILAQHFLFVDKAHPQRLDRKTDLLEPLGICQRGIARGAQSVAVEQSLFASQRSLGVGLTHRAFNRSSTPSSVSRSV